MLVHADNQAIDTLQKQLTTMILEPTKREQAEKSIRSGDHQIPMQRSQQTKSCQTQTEPSSRNLRLENQDQ